MGVIDNAERGPREIWGAEGQPNGATPYPHSQREADESGSTTKYLDIGASRADCTGGIPRGGVAGGIVSQLIAQAEDQLREAQECISWYQRSEEKIQRQLENLRQLQELAEQEEEQSQG